MNPAIDQKRTMIRSLPVLAIVTTLVLNSVWARDKTDVVIMQNGDRLTCEIKKLERGKLVASTSYMSTVYVDWNDIASVSSQHVFEVETRDGERMFGSLDPSQKDQIKVVTQDREIDLDQLSVVKVTPIEDRFWQRLDGYVDLGSSYTRANRVGQLTISGEANQRTRKRRTGVSFSSLFSRQEGLDSTSRHVVKFASQHFRGGKWFTTGLTSWTTNDELDLDFRATWGGLVGRAVVQSNRTLFTAGAGLVVTRERFSGEAGRNNLEALGSWDIEMFRFEDPEMDISTVVSIFPSLSSPGRVRMSLESSFRYEVFEDFFVSFSLFNDFDSDPPADDVERNDFGISTSVGWSF